jgi:hypothetical protein
MSDPLYWLADHQAVWSGPVFMLLVAIVIGCVYVAAWAVRE